MRIRKVTQAAHGDALLQRPVGLAYLVACLSLPEVNNMFYHLTLESNDTRPARPRYLWECYVGTVLEHSVYVLK